MQYVIKCGFCGFIFINDKEEDLSMEIDFHAREFRYLCRKCRKENIMAMAGKDDKKLPSIGSARF